MIRALAVVLFASACVGCNEPNARASTLKVSYYAQDSAFASAEPLRVSVGAGEELRSLRGIEMAPYHPFFVSGEMPLDSGATWPITVVMLGANADTAATAQASVECAAASNVERDRALTSVIRREPQLRQCDVGLKRGLCRHDADAHDAAHIQRRGERHRRERSPIQHDVGPFA